MAGFSPSSRTFFSRLQYMLWNRKWYTSIEDSSISRPARFSLVILKQLCLCVLVTISLTLVFLQGYRALIKYLAQPLPSVFVPNGAWQLNDVSMETIDKIIQEISAQTPEELPPMLTGMFHSSYPMFYVSDVNHPIRDSLMQFGFNSVGNLTKAKYLTDAKSSDSNIAQHWTIPIGQLQKKYDELETNKEEYIFFQNYMAVLTKAYESGVNIATIFYDSVSPASSVFWDADYDEYVRALQDQDSEWEMVVTAYHYPDREKFEYYYNRWRDGLPHTRAIPINTDFKNAFASIWNRRGIEKFLSRYLVNGKDIRTLKFSDLDPNTMMFDCSRKPREVRGCRIDQMIAYVFQASEQNQKPTGWLLQPPLFSYRPIPEETVYTGWKHLNDPGMLEIQQAIADTFKWNAENAEVFEGLHAFLLLTDVQQKEIFEDAKKKYRKFLQEQAELKSQNPDKVKLTAEVKHIDAASLLAWRLQSFMPRASWVPTEY
eukprot:Gregarina_sp_Poly_1__9845@NODE_634_length_7031_cov_50_167289_g484_i0_p3_GENE_NODE_634_length_7031_cov_50_167289_g484_i0NODE_634_length_7031_cov_50_167289_g484_i0_p3_ORF_typecomplete_len486_score63_89Ras/PF00071_22/2_1e02Ras/PF00071_22/3_8e02Ras/PF00071_22/1SCAMP/PF04144_13/0_011SCAMP/PF04144_13/5_2e03ToxREase5/PF15648_6/4_6e02ToxREase5/PF15648_6/1_5_NODE_634_length_7031_cov_50_167289_g484_i021703627